MDNIPDANLVIIYFHFQTLNLSSSEISAIYPDSFVLLPNLETLDLSNNLLVTINPNYFPLNTLHYINILNNKLVCDKKLRAILTKLDDMKVKYDVIKCGKFWNSISYN